MARVKYKWRIVGFIFKTICSLFIIGIVGLLAWRIIDQSNDPKIMDTVIPNEILSDTYEKCDGKLNAFYQDQTRYTRGEKNYGYFALTQSVIFDDADQIQFVMRYNNSTLRYTERDYSLPENSLLRDNDVFDVTVSVMYDLTPDDMTDNDGTKPEGVRFERFYASDMLKTQKTLYNYRKFVFDGIDITDDVLGIYVDIYYIDDVDYEKKPYGTLLLYYYEMEDLPYKLTKNDIEAIENYK